MKLILERPVLQNEQLKMIEIHLTDTHFKICAIYTERIYSNIWGWVRLLLYWEVQLPGVRISCVSVSLFFLFFFLRKVYVSWTLPYSLRPLSLCFSILLWFFFFARIPLWLLFSFFKTDKKKSWVPRWSFLYTKTLWSLIKSATTSVFLFFVLAINESDPRNSHGFY